MLGLTAEADFSLSLKLEWFEARLLRRRTPTGTLKRRKYICFWKKSAITLARRPAEITLSYTRNIILRFLEKDHEQKRKIMELLKVLLLFVLCFVMVLLASCASVGKHNAEKPAETAVINLLSPSNDGRREDDRGEVPYEHFEDYDEILSGDYEAELPKVAFSIKPKDSAGVTNKDGKKKGKGRKRNPCRRKYKDFCIHGVCQYLVELRSVSCICTAGYSGERCHLFSLPVGTEKSGYNRTTALAVMAVVLSSLCLIVIGILLALRYHKRGGYNVETEEKPKLGLASHK